MGCGLLLTWPQPPPEMLRETYDRQEYYAERGMSAPGAAWVVKAQGILDAVPSQVGRVLDFGAGEGHTVAAFRVLGLHADGVEPSQAGRVAARLHYGIELAADVRGLGRLPYSLVTLIHSLEHVSQPVETLRRLGEVVRPSGHLFVEVPHAGSVEMWRPRRRHHILDLPFHLAHYTPETLSRLAGAAGFEVVSVQLFNSDAIEWLLAWRARWRPHQNTPALPVPVGTQGSATGASPPPQLRRRDTLLLALRRRFPGWKFQMVLRLKSSTVPA